VWPFTIPGCEPKNVKEGEVMTLSGVENPQGYCTVVTSW